MVLLLDSAGEGSREGGATGNIDGDAACERNVLMLLAVDGEMEWLYTPPLLLGTLRRGLKLFIRIGMAACIRTAPLPPLPLLLLLLS